MLVKGLALTALVASTPLALVVTQDPVGLPIKEPVRAEQQQPATERRGSGQRGLAAELQRANANIVRARAELKAAQEDLQLLRKQLDAALDRLDGTFQPQRDRDCSPSRGRAMMSHYQWLRGQGHEQRATVAIGKVVDDIGDNQSRLNSVAWGLMTDQATAGKFDEVALAIVERMGRQQNKLHHNQIDTMALAYFLNGKLDEAIDLQRQAITKGGNSDDFRRRLRTYEAARSVLAEAQRNALPAATMVASKEEE